jgi:nucleoside-diphosphate-sugar epimerase
MQIGEIITRTFERLEIPLKRKNLCYPVARVLCPILEGIGNLTGNEPLMTRYSLSILSKNQTLNIDSAKRDLGYKPRFSVDEGLERFALWWKQK